MLIFLLTYIGLPFFEMNGKRDFLPVVVNFSPRIPAIHSLLFEGEKLWTDVVFLV